MATIKHYKVVAALPSTLVADSIYLVRVGTGFDLYVTNSSGTIVAYPANYQAGSANLNALSGLTGAADKAPYFTAAGAMAVYDLTVFGRSVAAAADAAAGRTLLGLDTAATRAATTSPTDTTSERLWRTNDLVKQTSTTDDTADRVMLTGAGGLLGTAEDLGSGFDWNNLGGRSRLVRGALNSTVNGPFTGAVWLMGLYVTLDSSGNNAVFHGAVVLNTTVRHFTRSKAGGTWSDWVEEWHSGNLDNTDSGWINCTLSGGWTSVSGRTAQYRRIGKRVYLRGAVQNATFANNNTVFWNIPSGYRPLRAPWIMVTTCGAFLVYAGGVVYSNNTTQAVGYDGFTKSGTVYVNLDSVSWDCA